MRTTSGIVDDRRQVDPVLLGAEQGVGVGADPVERHVAEVEQPAPADDDVEPEREQDEDDRVEGDAADVAAVAHARDEGDQGGEEREPGPPRHGREPLLERPEHAAAAGPALAVTGDPLVAADRRAGRALGRRRLHRPLERPRQLVVEAVAHVTPS